MKHNGIIDNWVCSNANYDDDAIPFLMWSGVIYSHNMTKKVKKQVKQGNSEKL